MCTRAKSHIQNKAIVFISSTILYVLYIEECDTFNWYCLSHTKRRISIVFLMGSNNSQPVHALIATAVSQNTINMEAWMSNYIPLYYVDVIIYPCPMSTSSYVSTTDCGPILLTTGDLEFVTQTLDGVRTRTSRSQQMADLRLNHVMATAEVLEVMWWLTKWRNLDPIHLANWTKFVFAQVKLCNCFVSKT